MPAAELKSYQFRREREEVWQELDRLVARAESGGLKSLLANDVVRLPALYRATLSSLSVARAISLDRNLVDYLESLSQRAYVLVYAPKGRLLGAAEEFFRVGFPSACRRLRVPIAVSALLLLLGTLVGFTLTTADSDNYYSFVSKAMAQGRDPSASTADLRSDLYKGGEKPGGALAFFAAYLFTHNAEIGILAFGLGFVFGIPAFLLIFANGLTLGAMAALYHSRGLSVELWAWLLPHGVTELTAVVLCGGAGMALGAAIVFPGRHSRLTNLARTGREAARVVVGAVAMLLLAGMIEGIFRQTVTSIGIRYSVAGGLALFWIVYFGFLGRKEVRA